MTRIYVAVGSVMGTAKAVAKAVEAQLTKQGFDCVLPDQASVAEWQSQTFDGLLVITSTTGRGEIPNNLLPFYVELGDVMPLMPNVIAGVIALGDSSYDDTFCGAGALMEERLRELQAQLPVPRVTIDATETITPDADALYWLAEWQATLR
ncbi:MAG: flavodoxin domain-containing protein [Bacterioplanes sp.]|nr:flavodoxin domain-containing protein [Bacterioplanes sp.]